MPPSGEDINFTPFLYSVFQRSGPAGPLLYRGSLPLRRLRRFPRVALWVAPQRGGPCRLLVVAKEYAHGGQVLDGRGVVGAVLYLAAIALQNVHQQAGGTFALD